MVALPRDIFTDEHELYREQFRRFAETEIAPRIDQWPSWGASQGRDGMWRGAGVCCGHPPSWVAQGPFPPP